MSAVLRILRRQRTKKRRSPTRRPRWLTILMSLVILTALGALIVAIQAFLTMPSLTVHNLSVRGNQRLTADDFRQVMSRNIGRPILLVDLEQVRQQIENSPGVRSARVARRLPDRLEAVITERRAVARASIGGRMTLLDDGGKVFASARPLPGDDRLPEVFGLKTPFGQPQLVPDDLPAIAAVLAIEKEFGNPPAPGSRIDLSVQDAIIFRNGPAGPPLLLDRRQPERNLKNLLQYQSRVADLASDRSIDLRFSKRLTLLPPPPQPPAPGTTTE